MNFLNGTILKFDMYAILLDYIVLGWLFSIYSFLFIIFLLKIGNMYKWVCALRKMAEVDLTTM